MCTRVVTEPDHPKFQPIYFEKQTVCNIFNGFPLMNAFENGAEFGRVRMYHLSML